MQANVAYSLDKLAPPDAVSQCDSEGYVNDDEEMFKKRNDQRASQAPSEMSEEYVDMSGNAPETAVNSAYNIGTSTEVPREDPPGYDYIAYEEVPNNRPGLNRPPPTAMRMQPNARGQLPPTTGPPPPVAMGTQPVVWGQQPQTTGPHPVAWGQPPVAMGQVQFVNGPPPVTRGPSYFHQMVAVEEHESERQAKILCLGWQGKAEIGIRAIILILELLMLTILITAFITWSVVINQANETGTTTLLILLHMGGVSFGTGFLACPMFFFLIIVTIEEIIFFLLRLCIRTKNSCTNCLLVWDIVNSTLVGILFFLSTAASGGLCFIWSTSISTSDATRAEMSLFALTTVLFFIAAILCIVKTVWIPALTYKIGTYSRPETRNNTTYLNSI